MTKERPGLKAWRERHAKRSSGVCTPVPSKSDLERKREQRKPARFYQ